MRTALSFPRRVVPSLGLALCSLLPSAQAADLSDLELRWLRGAAPVVEQALAQGLPLDVVLQPQPAAGLPPLGLAFAGGRCKLVFSLRGNPEAQATLERTAAQLGQDDAAIDAALGLMAAHEVLGHCARHLAGLWQRAPAGLAAEAPPATLDAALQASWAGMRATRREEGYADLAGLAWARAQHPRLAARLHAWLLGERSRGLMPGGHHDTLAWIRQPPCACSVAEAWASVLAGEAAMQGAGPDARQR